MKTKSKNIHIVLLSIFSFLYIFQIPLFSINMVYLLDVFIIVFLLVDNVLEKKFSDFKPLIGFVPFIVYIVTIYIVYLVINPIDSEIYLNSLKELILTVLHLFLLVAFVTSYASRYNITFLDFLKALIISGILQLILVFLSFVSPNAKNLFIETIINNVRSEAVVESTTLFSTFRCFGFADNLFDQFGFIVSFLVVASFIYGLIKRKIAFQMLGFSFVFMTLVNTRTGVILCLIGIGVIVLFLVKEKHFGQLTAFIILAGLTTFLSIMLLSIVSSDTKNWFEKGVNELVLLFEQGKTNEGTFGQIFSSDLVLPNNIIFGAGGNANLFGYSGIDSGYIQILWRFGIIGGVLLFFGLFYLLYVSTKESSSYKRCFTFAIGLIILVYNLKLFCFYMPGANFVIFTIPLLRDFYPTLKKVDVDDRRFSFGFRNNNFV